LIATHSARRRTERLLRDAGIQAKWGEPPSADDIRRKDDERLLSDPILRTPADAPEEAIVRALLAEHDPVQIAAAFVRLYRKGQAAPEDLAAAPEWSPSPARPERTRGAPENFEGGAWVSLSVGRTKSAEPRWLIPMLCKAGGITKRQIGAIRIEQTETLVEIDAASMDGFMARIGEGGRLEKSIRVTRVDRPSNTQHDFRPRAPRQNPRQSDETSHPRARPNKKSAQHARSAKQAKHRGPAKANKRKWRPAD
jgi:ATP-dependent RNA helicase DeaD